MRDAHVVGMREPPRDPHALAAAHHAVVGGAAGDREVEPVAREELGRALRVPAAQDLEEPLT